MCSSKQLSPRHTLYRLYVLQVTLSEMWSEFFFCRFQISGMLQLVLIIFPFFPSWSISWRPVIGASRILALFPFTPLFSLPAYASHPVLFIFLYMYKLYLLFAHYTRGADGTVCGGSISVINFLLRAKKWKILKANSFSWKLAHCMHVFMQICIKKQKVVSF